MKKEFIGFYEPTKSEIDNAWHKGFFAFDANSLLNLYRYTKQTREDFLLALKTIKDRLFIPHQAAYEYQTNRLKVIDDLSNAHEKLSELVRSNYTSVLLGKVNEFKRHPSIDADAISKLCERFVVKVEAEINSQKKNHPDFRSKDGVFEEITDITEKCIGTQFSKKELGEIYEEGKARYSSQIPPGYKDAANKKDKGDAHIYGDLVIWKELINHSKEKKQPLIFVTDDRKEDWWTIQNGKTIRPREELIKEFFDLTGIRILIYNADKFLVHAKERGLASKVKRETIDEIKDIRESDEKHFASLSALIRGGKKYSGGYFASPPGFVPALDWASIVSNNSRLFGPDPTQISSNLIDPGFISFPPSDPTVVNFDPSRLISPGFQPEYFNPGSAVPDSTNGLVPTQRFEIELPETTKVATQEAVTEVPEGIEPKPKKKKRKDHKKHS